MRSRPPAMGRGGAGQFSGRRPGGIKPRSPLGPLGRRPPATPTRWTRCRQFSPPSSPSPFLSLSASIRGDALLRIGWGEGGRRPDEVRRTNLNPLRQGEVSKSASNDVQTVLIRFADKRPGGPAEDSPGREPGVSMPKPGSPGRGGRTPLVRPAGARLVETVPPAPPVNLPPLSAPVPHRLGRRRPQAG